MKNLLGIKNEILKELENHTSVNPINSKELEGLYNLSGSEVRDIIRELRRDGNMIGSGSDRGRRQGGYYIIRTIDEYTETRTHIVNRIISLANTVRKMDYAAKIKFGMTKRQENLFDEDGGDDLDKSVAGII